MIKNMEYWREKNRQSKPSPMKKSTPCWDGYEMIGMKDKGGRQVPNCVPKKK